MQALKRNFVCGEGGFYLRFFTKRDAKNITEAINFPEVARYTSNIPNPYGIENAHEWLKGSLVKRHAGTDFAFGIFDVHTHKVIGGVGLHHIVSTDASNKRHNAELGCWITPIYWKRGIATKATGMVIHWGFVELGLSRIYARVLTKNMPSAMVAYKLGFCIEGIRRKSCFRNGRYYDDILFGLLLDDFMKCSYCHCKDKNPIKS